MISTPNHSNAPTAIPFRVAILWNTISLNEHGVSHRNQNELFHRLKTKAYFGDFIFNVVSASAVQYRNDDFIHI